MCMKFLQHHLKFGKSSIAIVRFMDMLDVLAHCDNLENDLLAI